jgi:hypothetical protein
VSSTESVLLSGWWRVRNSAWILVPALSLGLLTWAAFLYVGIRARNRKWLIFAVMWLAIVIGYYVGSDVVEAMPGGPVKDGLNEFLRFVPLLQWLVGVAHVAGTNRAWLRWKARSIDARPWYSSSTGVAPSPFGAPLEVASDAQVDAALSGTASAQTQPAPAAPARAASTQAAPVRKLDLNDATAEQFMVALGLDQAWGEWLVATRTRLGRFSTVDQLLTDGQVPPHLFLPARDKFTVSAPVRRPGDRSLGRLDF